MRISDWSSDVCSSDLNRALSAALAAITAAVVGVILNLAVWFAIHTLFGQVREIPFAAGTIDVPVLRTVNWPAANGIRSEEHTSELQSLMRISYAVFCLKKKKKTKKKIKRHNNNKSKTEKVITDQI